MLRGAATSNLMKKRFKKRPPVCLWPHATPYILCIVLLEFLFQLPPVAVLALLNPHLEFSLNCFTSSLSPSPKALFFSFKRTLLSLVNKHGLLSSSVFSTCELQRTPQFHSSPAEPHCPSNHRLPSDQRVIQGKRVDQVVVGSSKGREAYGAECLHNTCIKQIQCLIYPGWTAHKLLESGPLSKGRI